MSILKTNFTYIDLFAGIGGFRHAMTDYSHEQAQCLYASEIDPDASKVYEYNFKQKPLGDIRTIFPTKMGFKAPDVICGGFPCQTFSKAGGQAGFKDSRGTLFREIIRIIEEYEFDTRPKILLLENVQNLIAHDKGETWKTIHHEIQEAGYNVVDEPIVAAPKDFDVPQLRNRAIILAVRKDLYDGPIALPFQRKKKNEVALVNVLDSQTTAEVNQKYSLDEKETKILDCWDDFIRLIPMEEHVIGFPIWSDEFGKTSDVSKLPDWKQDIIKKNREFYKKHQDVLLPWMKKWNIREDFTPTDRKFEWQAGKWMQSVYNGIIQFRTSGVRVKRPTESPALVAMDHRPIYGPFRRYITPAEAAKLQSFPSWYNFDGESDPLIFKQLGNAVNVTVIEELFRMFVEFLNKNIGEKKHEHH
jgi:DNA (cytosine-5)-methyltransferase 1